MVKKSLEAIGIADLIAEGERLYPAHDTRYAGPLALSQKNGDIPSRILFVGEAPGLKGAGENGDGSYFTPDIIRTVPTFTWWHSYTMVMRLLARLSEK